MNSNFNYSETRFYADTKEPATLEAYRIKLEVFTPEALSLMGRQLIENYLLLSQEDLHLWETSPEEFGNFYYFILFEYNYKYFPFITAAEEGGEAWKYSLRVSYLLNIIALLY